MLVYEFYREVEWFWGLDTCVDDDVIKNLFQWVPQNAVMFIIFRDDNRRQNKWF